MRQQTGLRLRDRAKNILLGRRMGMRGRESILPTSQVGKAKLERAEYAHDSKEACTWMSPRKRAYVPNPSAPYPRMYLRDRVPLYSEIPRPGVDHYPPTLLVWVSRIIAWLILIGCAWVWIN